jgi:hypothetical protein
MKFFVDFNERSSFKNESRIDSILLGFASPPLSSLSE